MRALSFGWTGCADTSLDFSAFYSRDHTISAWVLFQYPYAYEGPVLAVEGSGGYLIGQGHAWGPQGAPSPNILILAEGSSQTFGAGDPSVVARWGFVRDRFPVVLSGAAQSIARDRKWNGVTDLQNMPLPAHTRTRLPFAPGDVWYTGQGWGHPTSYSHFGYAAFCWDFRIADYPSGDTYPNGTMQAPVHAACSGLVVEAYDQTPLGTDKSDNLVRIQGADALLRDCHHLLTGSAVVSKKQSVAQGQQVAQVSLFPDNAHLHMAGSHNTGGVSFVTVPLAISDYEVRQPGGTWRRVARGIPQPGEVVRRL